MNIFDNVIYFGDCIAEMENIPDESVDLVVADPPYYVMKKRDFVFYNRENVVQSVKFDHFKSYAEYIEFTKKWVGVVVRKMKPNASFYSFFANKYITDLIRIGQKYGMIEKNVIPWYKTNPALQVLKNNYRSASELIVFMCKGYPVFNFLGQNEMRNVFISGVINRYERVYDTNKNRVHETQKPMKIIKKIIQISSNPGQVVLSPFSGVGTDNVACMEMDRYCIGYEINKYYWENGVKRLNNKKGRCQSQTKQKTVESFFNVFKK